MKCVVDRKGASTGRLDQESFSCTRVAVVTVPAMHMATKIPCIPKRKHTYLKFAFGATRIFHKIAMMQTKLGIHWHGSDGEPGLNSLSLQDAATGNQNSNVVVYCRTVRMIYVI